MINYYNKRGQMDLSDRFAIETGLLAKQSFKKIAETIRRHPVTVAREVKENRTFLKGSFLGSKNCKYAQHCNEKHLCGTDACNHKCKYCKGVDCRKLCERYVSTACEKVNKPPYVCNVCEKRRMCAKDRFYYNAKYAEAAVSRRRSESRMGFRISEEQLKEMDVLITRLVRKGQPLTHIYAEHEAELPVGLRSLYNYIDSGKMTIKNIDLRRKVGYRQRKKGNTKAPGFLDQSYRIGRTYEDFEAEMKHRTDDEVVEMDTVRGRREKGKRLLTMMLRRYSILLLFLLPDGTSESIKRVFDYLDAGLGTETFYNLFTIILTDNGPEFKKADELEYTDILERRTWVFYCDPMTSWQKPHIEKVHEYIRYVLPKGKALNQYTQEDMTLLMNHINSTRRASLGNKAPYELILEDDEDMMKLWELLKMDLIPPDEVHLKPDLFIINK